MERYNISKSPRRGRYDLKHHKEESLFTMNPGNSTDTIDFWLVQNRGKFINCPHQPGNLKITMEACQKRQALSEKAGEALFQETGNYFLFIFNKGLIKCRDCSQINRSKMTGKGLKTLKSSIR
jgi:hypothetical protein